MMRTLYLTVTGMFWTAVIAFGVAGYWPFLVPHSANRSSQRVFSRAELIRHNQPEDCWMAIHGNVYNLTSYLQDHPSQPGVIDMWCGKQATDAYDTKARGRSHAQVADDMLERYRIGTFDPTLR